MNGPGMVEFYVTSSLTQFAHINTINIEIPKKEDGRVQAAVFLKHL